jgi:hypothetical protein
MTEPHHFDGTDADLLMGALQTYSKELRAVKNGAWIYAKLIARTDAIYRDLFKIRYGFDYPSKREVN